MGIIKLILSFCSLVSAMSWSGGPQQAAKAPLTFRC